MTKIDKILHMCKIHYGQNLRFCTCQEETNVTLLISLNGHLVKIKSPVWLTLNDSQKTEQAVNIKMSLLFSQDIKCFYYNIHRKQCIILAFQKSVTLMIFTQWNCWCGLTGLDMSLCFFLLCWSGKIKQFVGLISHK